MKIAASYASANMIPDNKLSPKYVIPNAFDKEVPKVVAEAVTNTVTIERWKARRLFLITS
jgi:malate dehydrogenase (oxaloacetate-decarboxylating)